MLKKYIDYMSDNPKQYWFKRKLFGWGWIPVTWQGWIVTLIYAACIIFFATFINDSSTGREVLLQFILPALGVTFIFIIIAYKTGEKPKWQWGYKDEE